MLSYGDHYGSTIPQPARSQTSGGDEDPVCLAKRGLRQMVAPEEALLVRPFAAPTVRRFASHAVQIDEGIFLRRESWLLRGEYPRQISRIGQEAADEWVYGMSPPPDCGNASHLPGILDG
jgi:hypothetical protein